MRSGHKGSMAIRSVAVDRSSGGHPRSIGLSVSHPGPRGGPLSWPRRLHHVVTSYRRQQAIADMAGAGWDGDLEAMRTGQRGVIVVDTSVWISHLPGHASPAVRRLRDPTIADEILVGDIVLTEVLQGARDEAHAARLEADLRQFPLSRWSAMTWPPRRRGIIGGCVPSGAP
jgi:hypothetical protein